MSGGISMKELAADLGVSTASISVALRGKPGISEETRIRILKEARRRGYDMSRLSGQQPKEVIQIIDYTYYINNDDPRQAFSYYGQFVDAAAAAITKRGYTPAGPLPGALGEKGSPGPAAGVILLGAKLMPQQVQPYIKENIPCVISGAILDDLPVTTIAHDNGFGIRSAIDHLYELGHRRIGYILSITGPIGQSRYDAFLAGIKDLELNAGEVMDMRSPDHFVDADGIFEAVCAAFKDSRPQATAFVCLRRINEGTAKPWPHSRERYIRHRL